LRLFVPIKRERREKTGGLLVVTGGPFPSRREEPAFRRREGEKKEGFVSGSKQTKKEGKNGP